jgi:hypothetical protein
MADALYCLAFMPTFRLAPSVMATQVGIYVFLRAKTKVWMMIVRPP